MVYVKQIKKDGGPNLKGKGKYKSFRQVFTLIARILYSSFNLWQILLKWESFYLLFTCDMKTQTVSVHSPLIIPCIEFAYRECPWRLKVWMYVTNWKYASEENLELNTCKLIGAESVILILSLHNNKNAKHQSHYDQNQQS